MTLRTCPFVLALAVACGPKSPMTTGAADTDASTSGDGTTTAPAPTSTVTSSTSSTTTADPSTSTADATASFIMKPDGGSCATGLRCSWCDTWLQDCPDGEKCTPWSWDDDDLWDRWLCAPIVPDPDHAGDPCEVFERPASGKDSCDRDAMCWDVDPDTLQGTCVPYCDGSPDDPICPPGTACLIAFDETISVCLPTCDPLLQDCDAGRLCISTQFGPPGFVCVPPAPGEPGQQHDPCDRIDACAPGLSCLNPVLATECAPDLPGCCVPFCDTTAPTCAGVMQECHPWFGDEPPPAGREHVGFCSIPL